MWKNTPLSLGLGIEEVEEEAVSAGDGFGELAVEGERDVGPSALSELSGDEAAALGGLAGVVGFCEGDVFGIPSAEEAVAAFFDPAVKVG